MSISGFKLSICLSLLLLCLHQKVYSEGLRNYSKFRVSDRKDPMTLMKGKGKSIMIIGTVHISEKSALAVQETIRTIIPDTVMLELDETRARGLPRAKYIVPNIPTVQNKTFKDVFQSGSSTDETFTLLKLTNLISYSVRAIGAKLAEVLLKLRLNQLYSASTTKDYQAGDEFKVAIQEANKINAKLLLGDQNFQHISKQLFESAIQTDSTAFQRCADQTEAVLRKHGMLKEATNLENSHACIEIIKDRQIVDKLSDVLKQNVPLVYSALIHERDLHMARAIDDVDGRYILCVVGCAHMRGIEETLTKKHGYKIIQRNHGLFYRLRRSFNC